MTESVFERAVTFQVRQQFSEAAELFDRILANTPDDPEICWRASICEMHNNRPDRALALIRDAIRLSGGSPAMARHEANLLQQSYRIPEAMAVLERAVAKAPTEVETLAMLADLRHFARDYQGAVQCHMAVLAVDPDNLDAIDGLRGVHFSMGQSDAAREWKSLGAEKRAELEFDYGPLVLSEEVSELSDAEYARALTCLEAVETMIARREGLNADHVGRPAGQWTCDEESRSLYRLLRTRDRDVIRKLRFYAQEFSGIKLPTMEPAVDRPHIDAKVPDNYDEFLRIWSPLPPRDYLDHIRGMPDRLRLVQPRKFAEIGWAYDGGIINLDTYFTLVYVTELDANGILTHLKQRAAIGPALALEIGGGYGNLGFNVRRLVPNTRYIIVDLPESLAFSSIYLSTLFPEAETEFVDVGAQCRQLDRPGYSFVSAAAFQPGVLGERRLDLAINTMSLAEMSDAQKSHYGAGIGSLLDDDGVFFEQNQTIIGGLDYVGSFMMPYFAERSGFVRTDLPHVHAGRGNLWRRPRRDVAMAAFGR
ncbi:hypothetical protein CU669_03305 [Paramagnetospirillum kuznetsovii]|uniref:Uncharacterized protein n=1 Tax=Paramagnetospirillum kuznetsovii TaxID=2053833 RepID=A0A364P1R4_9PROT|nr:putative sugar O-methyltransferase [Paramagnetospirillum kuznetsovii]RAU23200.1 hypothetical protein CU669_03305 [Paramagnetospirillum kuznetsovii]